MKKFYFLILFLSINSFSRSILENFILTNDGQKININANFFRIDNVSKFVIYKLTNSDIENKIKFKDLDYILVGEKKFKTYKLNNSKEINGYFVLAESASKTLIFTTKPNEDEEDEKSNKVNYVLYVLDTNNNILDSLQFDNLKIDKSNNVRSEIFSKIQFYFSDCEMLMNRISSYDNLSLENLKILVFFNSAVYIHCLK